MSRLPLASRDDLLAELELIAYDRDKTIGQANTVNEEKRQNRLESLDDWERDLREQLAEIPEVAA